MTTASYLLTTGRAHHRSGGHGQSALPDGRLQVQQPAASYFTRNSFSDSSTDDLPITQGRALSPLTAGN